MGDHHDLPFRVEYAKSNRSSCKGCAGLISKDSLRLAIMIQSPAFDGKVPNWYHLKCFWSRAKVADHADIHGIDSLRWEDQEKIKSSIGSAGGAGGAGGDNYSDFAAEYAKSNRSTCRGCGDKIDKDLIRLSKKDFETQRAKMYGPQDLWHHVDCFVTARDELEFGVDMDPTKIKGFNHLKKEDKELVLEKLGKGEKKKRKSKEESGQKAKKQKTDTAEEKALKVQNKLLWEIRDSVQKDVSTDGLRGLLEYNNQAVPSGESKIIQHSLIHKTNKIIGVHEWDMMRKKKLLDRVSDCMAFGALELCSECGNGQLAYSQGGYRCTGDMTEWTKCMHNTQTPMRKAFKIPKEYHDVEFLKKYKYVKRDRVFPKDIPTTSGSLFSAEASSSRPLHGMTFVISGKLSKSTKDITKSVIDLGGNVMGKVDKNTAAVLSTKAEVSKNSKVIKDAKKLDIHVVEEAFLEAVQKGGAALLITQHSICDWGSDPTSRIGDIVDGPLKSGTGKSLARTKKEETLFTKSVPTTMKMTVKGGAAVDPDSGLESRAHVLKMKDDLYTVVLGMVDIVRGTNSFYKLQLLESDTSKSGYWIFRSWGRVGTTIGGNKLQPYSSKSSALDNFLELYDEKTGNNWGNRKNFMKRPNKFYPIDIDHGADDENIKKLDPNAGTNSKLPKAIQDLVKLIFDVESMKRAMLEYEIDLKKMPLGKLSKKQIEDAYKVLTELNGLIDSKGSETKFLDASNRFYTLIPHDFGMKKPPMLDTPEVIKNKIEMLDNLLDLEVAYSMLKCGDSQDKDPIDVHFEKLKTDMEVLDKKSEEFERINTYVKNTHAATHNQYDLELQEVIKIKREGEDKRYRPFRDLHNRMLLWHGSRTNNYAGILSQGLRIAPPEAPVTGYMFGKGVYFADMVSKSANYCRTSKSDPAGIMLLCEVALGNMYELSASKYVDKLPKGKHSTKGMGMTEPDPKGKYTTSDELVIPMGKGQPSCGGYSSLRYNEYIVYDVSQINMKYLLRMDFKFKW